MRRARVPEGNSRSKAQAGLLTYGDLSALLNLPAPGAHVTHSGASEFGAVVPADSLKPAQTSKARRLQWRDRGRISRPSLFVFRDGGTPLDCFNLVHALPLEAAIFAGIHPGEVRTAVESMRRDFVCQTSPKREQ